MRNRWWMMAAAALVAAAAGCSEHLAGGAACPSLCPEQNIPLTDTVISGIAVDTTVRGYPPRGTEIYMLVAAGGGIDTRGVVRFDSLPSHFNVSAVDTGTTITAVDSAELRLYIVDARATARVTIEAYDVDTTAADTSTAAVLALFRPDRLLGSVSVRADSLADSVDVPIDTTGLAARMRSGAHLRIGLRAVSDSVVRIRFHTVNAAPVELLRLVLPKDTTETSLFVAPSSETPADNQTLRTDLTDYTLIAQGTPAPPAGALAVGGLPASRAFFRFDIPPRLLDSTTIVRATLLLHQLPDTGAGSADTVVIYPYPVTASPQVTEPAKAALLLGSPFDFGLDSLRVVPSDSGTRAIDIVRLVRAWRRASATNPVQRAIVLRYADEGTRAAQLLFYSSSAATDSLRPSLRIDYVPRVNFGLP